MSTETNVIKIFISYSWKPIQNKHKVLKLAERLTSDGIHVILDDWDLSEGQDKYSFMEQMVNNSEVKRVLLICNKEYSEKANQKSGGVGIESLIISDEIYTQAEQTKFVPIVFEYNSENKPLVPTFVKTRIFIDLSNDEIFEENYEKLLRNIYDKPLSKRPPIGIMPTHIQTTDPIFLLTAHKVSTIKNSLLNEKKNSILLIKDYLDTFLIAVKEFEIKDEEINSDNFQDVVMKRIDDLIILRNDFIDFIETITSYSTEIDLEILHQFFEKLLEALNGYEYGGYSSHSVPNLKLDSFRFFLHELFLTFSTLLIHKEKFNELAFILQNPFIVENKRTNSVEELNFVEFRQYNSTLNEFINQQHNPKRVSVVADTIKQRANEKIKFEKLAETDILLYYISLFYPSKNSYSNYWFPETSCYNSGRQTVLPKTMSERYFNKVKCLFGVNSKEELILKIDEINKNKSDDSQRGYFRFPKISFGLNIGDICKTK